MFHIGRLDSIHDPRLAPYRTMKRQADHRRDGIFVAEGDKVVHRLLASDLTVLSVCLPEERLTALEPLLDSRPENVPVFVLPKAELEKLTGYAMYQGVLAVAKIPPACSLETLCLPAFPPRLLGALDRINNSENVGAVVRNAAAFGAHGMLAGETSSSPFLRRAVRSSMGSVFNLPVVECSSLVSSLNQLKRAGLRVMGAHPDGQRMIFEANLSVSCCIVFGSEGFGISPEVLAVCDETLSIPMSNQVDSLNVGSAAAAFFCEAHRQRQLAKLA